MANQPTTDKSLLAIAIAMTMAMIVASCARMGSPDGGMYDETPPVMVNSHPAIGAVNSTDKRIVLEFDEFIKLQNASEKVVISPPQIDVPEIIG